MIRVRNTRSRWFSCALLVAIAATMTLSQGCALYRNDRCWMGREQYLIARDLFVKTGSLDLTRKELERYQWRRCKVNEAIYRIEKEFEVLPEDIPTAPVEATAAQ